MGQRVKVIDKDGDIIQGKAISYDVGLLDDLSYDSIGIEQEGKGYYISVPIPDIESIKVLPD